MTNDRRSSRARTLVPSTGVVPIPRNWGSSGQWILDIWQKRSRALGPGVAFLLPASRLDNCGSGFQETPATRGPPSLQVRLLLPRPVARLGIADGGARHSRPRNCP